MTDDNSVAEQQSSLGAPAIFSEQTTFEVLLFRFETLAGISWATRSLYTRSHGRSFQSNADRAFLMEERRLPRPRLAQIEFSTSVAFGW